MTDRHPILMLNANAWSLAILRIAAFMALILVVMDESPAVMAALPQDIFTRNGLMRYVPQNILALLLSTPALYAIQVAIIILAVAAMIGIRPFPLFALPAAVLFLLFEHIVKGFAGFINHAQLGLTYCCLILAAFPAADRLSVLGPSKSKRNMYLYPAGMFIISLLLTLPYAFIGMRRFNNGGLDLFFGQDILNHFVQQSFNPSEYDFHFGAYVLDYPLLGFAARAGFFVITIMELLTPLILLYPRFRRVWLLVMVPFHFSTLFTMNIFFWENLLLILILFTSFAYRVGPPLITTSRKPIVFYDGVCGLCNHFVQWLLRHDKEGILHYAPLQGKTAAELLEPQPQNAAQWSVILYLDGREYRRSDASLRIVMLLGGVMGVIASALYYIPRPLRDAVYMFIAAKRYAWFGKHDTCQLATPEQAASILD